MRNHLNRSAGWTLAAVAAVLACSSSSEPSHAVGGHPAGTTVHTTALGHAPWGAAISATGLAYVTRPGTDSMAIVDLAGPTILGSFQVGDRPDDVIFTASGNKAFVTNLDAHTVGVINTGSATQVDTWPVGAGPLRLLLGPGEHRLYVTLDNGNLQVLDATTGAVDTTIYIGPMPNGMALDKVSGHLFVSATATGTITEISTAGDSVLGSIFVGGVPQDLAVDHTKKRLYVANEGGWLDVRHLVTGARVDSVSLPGAFGLALTTDNEQAWVAQSGEGRLAIVDLATMSVQDSIILTGTPRHIAFPRSGAQALIADEAGAVLVVE